MPASNRRRVQTPTWSDPAGGDPLARLVPELAPPPSAAEQPADASGSTESSDRSGSRRLRSPAPDRRPTKVNPELLQRMRDAVVFLRGHGRPMAELGELVDEALEEWLARKQAELNDGQEFPRTGLLR